MKYAYPITVFWPGYDTSDILCVCGSEADAQEMILSIEQDMPYEEYLYYLEYDSNIKPQQFFYNKNDCLVNATYAQTTIFE